MKTLTFLSSLLLLAVSACQTPTERLVHLASDGAIAVIGALIEVDDDPNQVHIPLSRKECPFFSQ